MSWLNYTTYTTYTPMSDAHERMLMRHAFKHGQNVSLRESASNAVLRMEKVFLKLASFCRAASQNLARAHSSKAPITLA